MQFNIITIFPDIFNSYFNESILRRAQKNKIIEIKIHNLRDWTTDKHKTVDDTPYGGGAGMVMKVEPLYKALNYIVPLSKGDKGGLKTLKKETPLTPLYKGGKNKIILLSARGKKWNQQLAKKYSKLDNITLICGRYEGIDERVKNFIDEEISIGDYVLTGGEIGAMAIVDSITRLLPGALGNAESAKDESHSTPGLLEYPQYTRPEVFSAPPLLTKERDGVRLKKFRVPKILLSGNHKKIEEWRRKKMKKAK